MISMIEFMAGISVFNYLLVIGAVVALVVYDVVKEVINRG